MHLTSYLSEQLTGVIIGIHFLLGNHNFTEWRQSMRRAISIVLAVSLIMSAGITTAQMQGGPGGQGMMSGQYMMGPGMMRNMEMISGMMSDMHQMLGGGHMTQDQQRQMLEMMHQMGGIMQEMGTPKEGRLAGEHYRQLQKMQKQLNELKKQVK
jgi:hypothetical protein